MKNSILLTLTLAMIVLAIAGCGGPPAPVSTPLPPPFVGPAPTQVTQPTAAPQPSATQVLPTATAQATATTAPPTAGATQPTAAPTTSGPTPANAVPATATVAPTIVAAPPAAPPGLYVTNIRLEPSQPAHAKDIAFSVSFLNTASADQNPKWVIFVYRADNPTRANTQTAVTQSTVPVGTLDVQANPTVRFGGTGNACDYYFAQVDLIDINNKGTPIPQPDGQPYTKGFAVCN
jgi:hypothetical protein